MTTLPCPACGHTLIADARADRCPSCDHPTVIAFRYRLLAARGPLAGGVVYEGVDDSFGQKVAVLFVADGSDASAVERFVAGHRLFAELGGRGLVKIHEISGSHDARAFVVMDWLDGGTLEQRLQSSGPLDHPTLVKLISDLLTGLGKAHRSIPPLVHGHIHPGQIGFRRTDEAVLFGFGHARSCALADAFGDDSDDDEPPRKRDLQQLAVAIHYAATGSWIGTLPVHDQIQRIRSEIEGQLGQLVARMLEPDDGYASTLEAQQDLERLRADDARPPSAPLARNQPRQQPPAQRAQASRHVRVLLFAGFSVFMAGTLVTAIMASSEPHHQPAPRLRGPNVEPVPKPPPVPPQTIQLDDERDDDPGQTADEPQPDAQPDPTYVDIDCILDPNLPKCKRAAAASKPTSAPSLPNKLGSAQIKGGIDPIKPATKACGVEHGAPPGTAVSVKFELEGETGRPRLVQVTSEHADTPLGDCIVAVAQQATFPRFQAQLQGFTYKFRLY